MLVAEISLHLVEARIHQNLLEAPNYLIELVVFFVLVTAVDYFKHVFIAFTSESEVMHAYTYGFKRSKLTIDDVLEVSVLF